MTLGERPTILSADIGPCHRGPHGMVAVGVEWAGQAEHPAGVLRRVRHDGGERDESFGTDLKWGRSALLYEHENGDLESKFIPISTEEAERIVDRIRHQAESGT